MEDNKILKQIKDEHALGLDYIQPARDRYRRRLLKWIPQEKGDKMNINLIANTIDTLIASFWANWVKVKFISKQWWIGQEEADNLNSVAEFDKKDWSQAQIEYQVEQDSLFFGVGIVNRIWWDWNKMLNKRRSINPLSWIPDPLPTQTWQFDWQNYRFHWFNMRSTVYDMKSRYDNDKLDEYFKLQSESSETQQTKDTYSQKWGYWSLTCDNLDENFSLDVYTHYTIVDWYKRKYVTDSNFSILFDSMRLEPVLKEEKLDPMLVPRPIMLNYYDPQRESPLGWSICDKLEDKQNAISILFNANLIKTKKEATWWDFLVNSRLIKNKDEFKKKSTDTRYFFVDEDTIGNNPIQNAMFELPQSQIKWDTFNMISAIEWQVNRDSKIDALQAGIVPDKSMTKAEAQQIQGNANAILSLKNGIKSRFYQEFYHQRWRGYLENMKDWQKKFALLSSNFEWKGIDLKKDEFVTRQIPYIMVWNNDDIMAINEKQKSYLNMIYPQIIADPMMDDTSKRIFSRLVHRVNGLQSNVINSFLQYSPAENYAKSVVNMINMEYMPKTIFKDPSIDYKTLWIYLQKAEEWEIKDKLLTSVGKYLLVKWEETPQAVQWNQMANSAANIQMSQSSQNSGESDILTRPGWDASLDTNQTM